VLISSENHFVFTPLLAETVGREISLNHVVVPGRQMVGRTRWLTAEVTEIDRGANRVHYVSRAGKRDEIAYEHLVLACGSVVDLSVIPGLATHAYPLKTLGDAMFLGNDLIGRLEEASVQTDLSERERLLTVVVIGGGFSGVEVAGAINDLMERTRRFYPQLSGTRPRVILLQSGERILPELQAASLSQYALEKLRASGVEVRLKIRAQEATAREVVLATGEHIAAGTIVCTVGTACNPILRTLGLPLERCRLKTESDMRVVGTSNVWAIGDNAMVPNAYDGKPSPPTAQFATRQSKQLAQNLACILENQPTRPFSFKPLGIMAAIGHHNAVAEVLGLRLSGIVAWFFWRGVYLAKMPTLLRKIEVAIDWAWSILFSPNLVQLQMERTLKVGRAHYSAGEFVFHKGDFGDHFYLIESGKAAVYLDEAVAPIAFLGMGDHFGEGSVMEAGGKGRRRASIKAESGLDVVTIAADDFRRLTDSLGALKRDVQQSLAAQSGYVNFLNWVEHDPLLLNHTAGEWMSSPAETLSPEMTLEQTVRRFHNGRPGYPVSDATGKLVGYCGRQQLYDAIRALIPSETPLEKFMLVDPPAVLESERLSDVVGRMRREHMENLPVLAADGSGRVVGVLSPLDVYLKEIGRAREVYAKLAFSAQSKAS
jgi:NADH dehydrogenase